MLPRIVGFNFYDDPVKLPISIAEWPNTDEEYAEIAIISRNDALLSIFSNGEVVFFFYVI